MESIIAGGVVRNSNGHILIVSQYGKTWSLPKGHVEKNEDLIQAARREIYEESGVDRLQYIKDLGSYQRYKISVDGADDLSELKHIFIFLFDTDQMNLSPIDPCNPEARWVVPEDVAGLLTHQKDKEFWLSIREAIAL
jgi:8-oxo-dGTP pyrophosphatase MutT (NUDIX family)